MKNSVLPLFLLLIIVSGSGCLKDKTCTPKMPSSEAATIQTYAGLNGIIAVPHSSGLYYEILDPGTGATATATSTIFITYTGKMLDGTVFDQQNNSGATGWPLNQLIEGWRVGIPLIKEGGRIRLLIPSSMAYGCTGYGGIPGDAILDFDITLVDVQ
ncbi:MAG: FKBP-type peptidyl-prolyl cis-trans isomerase [Chitinophagaceae bacterium]|nr:FKBP-type peptidyl-prolyl cis-trans isomerase [Chitinophagaceae bacterium]